MAMPTLLGYLARFGSFSTQSEVLCTQGLKYLLQEHPEAHSILANEVEARTGVRIGDSLTWAAEAVQDDKGRVDLEACTGGGVPVVKIEAKLGADLTPNQLLSYVANLRRRNNDVAALLVLVPKLRTAEATRVAAGAFALPGTGPWRVTNGHLTGVAVIAWDELFAAFEKGQDERFRYELEQLQAMYRVLSGDYIAPLARCEDILQWRARETDFVNLVDQATRKLTMRHKLLPLRPELLEPRELPDAASQGEEQRFYRRRYVSPLASHPTSYYCIGVRDSFAEWVTPVWMRFHKVTGDFVSICCRIRESPLRSLESSGHIWLPLDVPLDVSGEQMVQALVEQAEDVIRVAYQVE